METSKARLLQNIEESQIGYDAVAESAFGTKPGKQLAATVQSPAVDQMFHAAFDCSVQWCMQITLHLEGEPSNIKLYSALL